MDILSWDGHDINDTTNFVSFLYSGAYGLPKVNARSAARVGRWPLISAVERPERIMFLEIIIRDLADLADHQTELQQWFDPEDETPKQLIVEDLGGGTGAGNDRYVYAICEELQAAANDENNYTYVATLKVHGDVRWQTVDADINEDIWDFTATGATHDITITGEDEVYPDIWVRHTSAKSTDYLFKRQVAIRWNTDEAFTRYPTDVADNALNTAALVTATKMQADGDDLRVVVNGIEVDRWLQDINTTTTQVWVNLDWLPKAEGTLKTAIASSGAVTSIELNASVAKFPSSGAVMIGTETFTYTGKNATNKTLIGCVRAARSTSMAAHSVGDAVWWIQHDIRILYGNASATEPTVDNTYKQAFSLASLNASWIYEDFGLGTTPGQSLRAGSWQFATDVMIGYTGNRGGPSTIWQEVGMYLPTTKPAGIGRWYVRNPCGISNANFTNGEKWAAFITHGWTALIISSVDGINWITEDSIAIPTVTVTWQSWSDNEAITSGSKYVGVQLIGQSNLVYLEFADCTLTIASPPTITISAELGNDVMDFTLTNETTGEAIKIFHTTLVTIYIFIYTSTKTILGGSVAPPENQLQALTLVGGPRKDWLRLVPGVNTLRFDEANITAVRMNIWWRDRYYQ